MNRIAIPKVRDDRPPVEYRIRFDPKLSDELEQYRRLYIQTYGQEIEAKDLIEPMIRRCLSSDRQFQKFKRQKTNAAPALSVQSKPASPA